MPVLKLDRLDVESSELQRKPAAVKLLLQMRLPAPE
jgi:hypothetical protein